MDTYHKDIRNNSFKFLFKIPLLNLKPFKDLNKFNKYFNTIIYNNIFNHMIFVHIDRKLFKMVNKLF